MIRLEDVLKKTKTKDVFNTSSSRRMFAGLGTIIAPNTAAAGAAANNANKKVIIRVFAIFIDCISEIENTQVEND